MTTVLLDLDGVIRHFDPGHVADVERRHELPSGALTAAGFRPELLELVVTGRITRAAWVARVGVRVGSSAAAEEWLAERGRIDWELLALVDDLRDAGVTVAVLTNGTDTIPQELAELGVSNRFDAVFNSAEIGFAKPDRRAFEHVCARLGVPPRSRR